MVSGKNDEQRAAEVQAALAAGRAAAARAAAAAWIGAPPDSAEAHNALGNVLVASGERAAAEASFRRATELDPSLAKAFSNLGAVRRSLGDVKGAIEALDRAVAIDPASFRAWTNLGNTLRLAGRAGEACAAYERSIAIAPSSGALLNLGTLLSELGRVAEATDRLAEALRMAPRGRDAAPARSALVELLVARGRRDEAAALVTEGAAEGGSAADRVALAGALLLLAGPARAAEALGRAEPEEAAAKGPYWALRAKLAEIEGDTAAAEHAARTAAEAQRTAFAWCEVARLAGRRGDEGGAAAALRRAHEVDPGSADACVFEGTEHLTRGDLAAAEAAFVEAARRSPGLVEPDANLATIALRRGDVEGSVELQRSVLRRRPGLADAHSNLLLALHYRGLPPRAMLEEHLAWSRAHAPLASAACFAPRAPAAGRRLRVGYVSADLREHAVARLFEELLASHDRERFAIFLYDLSERQDAFTARMKALGDTWREVHGKGDPELARTVRADAIDVLVDLGGHTAGGALGAFAQRPAPVQVSFLGYPDTTGLAAIDARITDAIADPPGEADRHATEELVRLPRCAWSFRPDDGSPRVVPRPPGAPVVFGIFNNVPKIGEEVRRAAARVLAEAPGSRLLMKGRTLHEPATRDRFLAAFREAGVADRVELRAWTAAHDDHLATYGEVDVALDSFPYAGTTTTCEALWMGVPVVTLAGDTHAARVGASLVSAVGLPELVAADVDEYVGVAVKLAVDRPRLAALRASLRGRVERSPLRDGASYARAIEAVYLERFERWRAHAEATDGAADVWMPLSDGAVVSAPDRPDRPDRPDVATRFVLEEQGDGFEPEVGFVRALLGEGDRAVDVGAGLGVFALPMARRVGPSGLVLAFEPTPSAAAFLRRSAGRAPGLRVVEAAVGAVALDDFAEDLAGLSFVKVGAEGPEPLVLRGARRLVAREDPIWLWGLQQGREVAPELLGELARSAPHLGLMRWVADLGALVPFDPAQPIDPRWLAVVALSPARKAQLRKRRLAVGGSVRAVLGGSGHDPLGEALAIRERARRAADLDDRWEGLVDALGAARQALRERSSASRAFTLARLAHETGFDGEATVALDTVLEAIARGAKPALSEPTLAPLPEQDGRLASASSDVVVEAMALEARLVLGAWSSYHAAPAHRAWLERLAVLGPLSPRLARMREVLGRFGALG